MKKEYKTTSDSWNEEYKGSTDWVDENIPDPIEPEGDGWKMVGSASVLEKFSGRLFWFWERIV